MFGIYPRFLTIKINKIHIIKSWERRNVFLNSQNSYLLTNYFNICQDLNQFVKKMLCDWSLVIKFVEWVSNEILPHVTQSNIVHVKKFKTFGFGLWTINDCTFHLCHAVNRLWISVTINSFYALPIKGQEHFITNSVVFQLSLSYFFQNPF